MRRRLVGGVLAGLAAATGLGAYAVGDTWAVRATARTFLDGVRAEDCARVAAVSVWSGSSGSCAGTALGFGRAVDGYRLTLDRVGLEAEQAAVGVWLPGEARAYSLHLVRRGSGWVVDGIDPGA